MTQSQAKEKTPVELFWQTSEYDKWFKAINEMVSKVNEGMTRVKTLPAEQAERVNRAIFEVFPDAGLTWRMATRGPMIAAEQCFAYAIAVSDRPLMSETEALLREAVRLERKIEIIKGKKTSEITPNELDSTMNQYRAIVDSTLEHADALYEFTAAVETYDEDKKSKAKARLQASGEKRERGKSPEYTLDKAGITKAISRFETALSFRQHSLEDKSLNSLWMDRLISVQRSLAEEKLQRTRG